MKLYAVLSRIFGMGRTHTHITFTLVDKQDAQVRPHSSFADFESLDEDLMALT